MQVDPRPELLVDPAMLVGGPEDDSEYEYEYDETETETFYVTLDLTSCNGILRPLRRRTEPLATTPSASSPFLAGIDARPSHLDIQNDAAAEDSDNGLSPNQFQLLDFNGLNPIVSYQNQIFSCSWADMIGTELLFTDPNRQTEPSDLTLLKREKKFDLLSANSVKLVGQKANLLTSSGKAVQNASTHDAAATRTVQTPRQQQPQPGRNIAPRNGRQTDQALFLERLMNTKQAKNENDIVRTVFSMRRGPNFDGRLQGWARTEKRMTEVQNLNRAMLQGDMDALMALERIYAQVDNDNNNNHNNDAVTDSSSTRPSG